MEQVRTRNRRNGQQKQALRRGVREGENDMEKFQRVRLAAEQQRKAYEERADEVDSSAGVQAARQSQAQQVVAFVRNIDFMATCSQLVPFLKERMQPHAPGIIRCEINTKKQQRGRYKISSGTAFVTLQDQITFDYLIEICASEGLIFNNRTLVIEKARGAPPDRTKTLETRVFEGDYLQLGQVQSEDAHCAFQVRWQSDPGIRLELNGHHKRQLSIDFSTGSERYQVAVGLKHIVSASILNEQGKSRVLVLQLNHPPFCFRQQSTATDFLFASLLGLQDSFVWEESADKDTKEWTRTTDPTNQIVFGRYLTYRILMPHTNAEDYRELLRCLEKFALKCSTDNDKFRETVHFTKGSDDVQWTGGYDEIFRELSFAVKYDLHILLASNKILFGNETTARTVVRELESIHSIKAAQILSELFSQGRLDAPIDWLLDEIERAASSGDTQEFTDSTPDDSNLIRRVLVTPLRICPLPAELDFSNRIIRQFLQHKDRFLRVTFVDEDFRPIFQAGSDDIMEGRVRKLVHEGIVVAGRRFVFLAWSNSQLREQSCWFYDEEDYPNPHGPAPKAEQLRQCMGDLSSISAVGKFAARLGQGFSSTVETVSVPDEKAYGLLEVERNGFCFSDGVGLMSNELRTAVLDILGRDGRLTVGNQSSLPSAFQIRYAGCKGVVAVPPSGIVLPEGYELGLRPSMKKFEGNRAHRKLEIVNVAKPITCYLNRQIILLLSTLGVADKDIMRLVEKMVEDLKRAGEDRNAAEQLMLCNGGGGVCGVGLKMLRAGFDVHAEKFLSGIVRACQRRALVDLQKRARIHVPQGISLMGIMDETGEMISGTIFFQYTDRANGTIRRLLAGTRVAVSRNPSLHPGDVLVLVTCDLPRLHNLVDVAVFPSQGTRPHPNQMSGGDLDGDIYTIIFDPSLVPTCAFPPMEYSAREPDDSRTGESVNATQMQDFFVDYMKNDNLGRIANAHLALADQSPDGAKNPHCLQLAALHSIAVDFVKTGVPASLDRVSMPKTYPTFMERKGGNSYNSTKVLGQIFDYCMGLSARDWSQERSASRMESAAADNELLLPGREEFRDVVWGLLLEYNWELWEVMQRYEVHDEAELISGCVLNFSRRAVRQRLRGGVEAQAQLSRVLAALWKRYRGLLASAVSAEVDEECFLKDRLDPGIPADFKLMQIASACYEAAYTQLPHPELPTLLSFAWVVHAPLCAVKRLQGRGGEAAVSAASVPAPAP